MHANHSLISRLRHLDLATADAWRDRLVVWAAAATAGLAVVAFTSLAVLADQLFQMLYQQAAWSLLLITPLSGVGILALTRRVAPMAAGSGIPQVMVAMTPGLPASLVSRFVSLKIVVTKMFLGCAALAAGFSLGREGPSVQISASVMHAFRGLLSPRSRISPADLLLAGGAAGIAAAFNAPLAGIMFAIEELSRRFEARTSGLIISAIVLAGVIAVSVLGNFTYFGRFSAAAIAPGVLGPVLICMVLAGTLGGLFSRVLLMASTPTRRFSPLRWRATHPYLFAAACGLIVAGIGLASSGTLFGSGYAYTRHLIEGTDSSPIIETAGKFLSTVASYWSGIPGGIFAPALAIGAGIGQDVSHYFPAAHQTLIAIGMVAFLAAATQAPLTAFIIVMEMTDGHQMVLLLMASAFVANLLAKLVSKPLYKTLADAQLMTTTQAPPAPTEAASGKTPTQ